MSRSRNWLAAATIAASLFAQSIVAHNANVVRAEEPVTAPVQTRQTFDLFTRGLDLGFDVNLFGLMPVVSAQQLGPAEAPMPVAEVPEEPAAVPAARQPGPAEVPMPVAEAPQEPVVLPGPKGKTIFIDPGHGGKDPGAVHTDAAGNVDLTEKEANLDIALKLAEMLRQDGYDVALSRDVDKWLVPGGSSAVDLQARVDLANEFDADLLIDIHNNGSVNKSLQGTEVYYCSDRGFGEDNRRLAVAVQEALLRNLRAAGYDTVDRGIKDDRIAGHFAVLAPSNLNRPSRMPGILGESLFMSNDQDAAALKDENIRTAIARGYFEGIKAYFGDLPA